MSIHRARRSHRTVNRHLLLFLFGFTLLILAPVLDTIGAAQGLQITAQPTATPTEEFDPPLQARSTPTPTPRVTEEPDIPDNFQANPTEVPETVVDDLAPNPDPATLTLNKGVCDDPGFDPSTATGLDAFQAACFSPDGEFEFTVADGAGFTETASTSLGSVQFTVPASTIVITETIPDGFGDPSVFCWSSLLPTPAAQPFLGNGPTWDVAEGEQVECWWFNVSEPAPQGHTIRVSKHVCPEGFAIDGHYWTLANGCTERLEGIGFALTVDGGTVEDVTDANGQIEWTDVDLGASGQLQLDEDIPAGYGEPVVWCVNYPQEAADAQDFDFFQVTATDGLVIATPEQTAPYIFSCTYFNVIDGGAPGDLTIGNAQDGQVQAVTTVNVIKHRCPLGVPEDTTLDQYLVICAELFDGVSFTLDHGGGTFPAVTANGGEVEWTDVPAGEIEIQETLPDGFKDPLAFCTSFDGEQELESGQVAAPGGIVPLTIAEGATNVTCWLFNIQDPDLATSLTINKWRCHPTFDVETDDPVVGCFTPMDGVTFNLGDMEATTGEAIPGVARFVDVPTGDHLLTEVAPEDIDHAFITGCTVNGQGVPVAIGGTDFPSLNISIEAGEHWVCDWYNVAKAEARVVVHKRLCDPGLDLIVEDDIQNEIQGIIDSCPTDGDGIEFTLDNADGSSSQAIASGHTLWDGVPVGPFTVTEQIPAGYGEPIVYCQTSVVDEEGDLVPGGWERVIAPGGVIAGSMSAEYGETFSCWILNVPADDGDLTVMKWTCPPGYDVHAEGADPKIDCTETVNDIQFQFGQPGLGMAAVLQATGEIIDGGVRFTSLEPGDWRLVEFSPPWAESAFVGSCTVNGALVPADPPLHEGFEWDIEVGAAETILCHWYNVPVDDGNSVTVVKWLCPAGFDEGTQDPEVHCTEPMGGVTFTLGALEAITGDDQGTAVFEDVPVSDDYGLTEILPEGIDRAIVGGCTLNGLPMPIVVALSEPPVILMGVGEGNHWVCTWYNVPVEDEENSITILKWICPEGTASDQDQGWYEANCVQQHDGVEFKVASDIGIAVMETVGGTVQFDALPAGTAGIQETIPEGFGPPVVFCATDAGSAAYPAPTGHWEFEFANDGLPQALGCHVYNIPAEDGSLTILKWTCPEGYDLNAAGADPQVDCTEATDGIDFQFGLSGIGEEAVLQTTGDLIPGGVFFDDLEPDTYKAMELVPEAIGEVFVLECTGHIMGVLQPYPLQTGNVLEIDIDAGEHLTCHWYNVPETDGGTLIVVKYICATETFVSEVDCQIYEDGKTFDLLQWNGGDGVWEAIDTEITDGVGQITWTGLEAGDYGLDEHDSEWCHLTTNPVFGPGDFFSVSDNEETTVSVYNCDPGWTTTTIPTKYPNTGVGPGQGSEEPTEFPAFAPLVGLLVLFASRRSHQAADPASAPGSIGYPGGEALVASRSSNHGESAMRHTLTRRKLAALLTLPLGGTALARSGSLAQADQAIELIDGTPTALCLPATSDPEGAVEACVRGPVPAGLQIDAIGVEAPVEILETVGGVMQQPSDEAHVAWYKESARLGETGNLWIAGHLNWWGFPEAVFFSLGTLREGDTVVLHDAEETAYTYEVEWVRQESNLEPPAEEVLGMTNYEAITLMTCGGQWNSSISEYDERTVARARRVADAGNPAA